MSTYIRFSAIFCGMVASACFKSWWQLTTASDLEKISFLPNSGKILYRILLKNYGMTELRPCDVEDNSLC